MPFHRQPSGCRPSCSKAANLSQYPLVSLKAAESGRKNVKWESAVAVLAGHPDLACMFASSGKTAVTRLSSITTLWPCPVGSRFLLPRKEGSGAGTRTLHPLDRAEMAQAAQSVHQRYPRRRPRRACGCAIKGAPAGCRPPDDPLQFPQAPIVRCGGLAGQRPAAGPVAGPWRRDRSAIARRAAWP